MKKLVFVFKEILSLIKENRLYVLAPLLITLVLVSVLVYNVGPSVIVTFIYAGV